MERKVCLAMVLLLISISHSYSDSYTPDVELTKLDLVMAFLEENTPQFIFDKLNDLAITIDVFTNDDSPADMKNILEQYDVEKIDTTLTISHPLVNKQLKTTQKQIRAAQRKKDRCRKNHPWQYPATISGEREKDNTVPFKRCVKKVSGHAKTAATQLSITIDTTYQIIREDYQRYGNHGLFSPNTYNGPLENCIRQMTELSLVFNESQSNNLNCHKYNIETKEGIRKNLLNHLCDYEEGTLSQKYNAYVSEAGIIPTLLDLHNKCREQEIIQDNLWKDKLENRTQDLKTLRNKKDTLDKYCKITTEDLQLLNDEAPVVVFGRISSEATNETEGTPGNKCEKIEQNFEKLSDETAELIPNSLQIAERHSRINSFEDKYEETVRLLDELKSLGETIKIAKERAKQQKIKASEIEPSDELKNEYKLLLKRCKDAYNQGASDPQKYFESIHYSNQILDIFLTTLDTDFESEAEDLLSRAKKDFIVSEEEALFQKAEKQKDKVQRSMYRAVIHGGHGVLGVLPKAEQLYSDLPDKHTKAKNLLKTTATESTEFNDFETYFEGDTLNFRKALGNLRKMQTLYDTIINDIEKDYQENPGKIFSAQFSTTKPEIPQEIFANTNTPLTYEFEIENPNDFPLNKTTFSIALDYEPKGLITEDDIQTSLSLTAGTEGKNLIIEIDEIPPKKKDKTKITIKTQLISAEIPECKTTVNTETAKWECSSQIEKNFETLDRVYTILLPFDKTLGGLLDSDYDTIEQINGDYYVKTPSTTTWKSSFTRQDPITITEESSTSLKNGFRVFTNLKIKNNLPLQIDTTITHPLPYTAISEFFSYSSTYKDGTLSIPLSIPPDGKKTINLEYKVTDKELYAEELLSELPYDHLQYSEVQSLYNSGDYENSIAMALSIIGKLDTPEKTERETHLQQAILKLMEYELLSEFLPTYSSDYEEIKILFQAGNTSLTKGNNKDAEAKFDALLSYKYDRNTILLELEKEDTKMDSRLEILSKIQRLTISENLAPILSEMNTIYNSFHTSKTTHNLTNTLILRKQFYENNFKTQEPLEKLLDPLLKNREPYSSKLEQYASELPNLRKALSTELETNYPSYTPKITTLESTIQEEKQSISSLDSKTPEEKIIALAELGKSELQYNELDRIRNNLKIHLENAIGREPENSRESQTAYEDGRLLDALALLPLTTTQSPGKIYPYLFLLSALLLVIIYLKRDAIFNTKKESAITRIEKKIQLRNS